MLFRVDDNGTLKSFNVVDSTVVADLFDSTVSYTAGDYVFYTNKLYKFTSNHSGAWVAADVTEVNIIDEIPQSTSDLTNDSGFLNSSTLPKATDSTLGGVIIGSGISVNSSGVISIPTPMQFKGTVGTGGTETSLPSATAANTGYVYKVIEDGTYQSVAAKVGDLLISNGSAWVLVPSGDDASAVQSVNGQTGVVVLTASDVGAGTYSKPSGGIPDTDLSSAVQASLGKADTALQSAPVTSVNTKTGAVTLGAGDIGYDDSATYDNGTVGKGLTDLKGGLNDRITKPSSPTTGQFLKWSGSAWVASDLPVYSGGVS